MKKPSPPPPLSPQEFTAALQALGWKQSDLCTKAGLNKQTPSRWATGQAPVPLWVSEYLRAMLAIQALHSAFVGSGHPAPPTDNPSPDAQPQSETKNTRLQGVLDHIKPA